MLLPFTQTRKFTTDLAKIYSVCNSGRESRGDEGHWFHPTPLLSTVRTASLAYAGSIDCYSRRVADNVAILPQFTQLYKVTTSQIIEWKKRVICNQNTCLHSTNHRCTINRPNIRLHSGLLWLGNKISSVLLFETDCLILSTSHFYGTILSTVPLLLFLFPYSLTLPGFSGRISVSLFAFFKKKKTLTHDRRLEPTPGEY